MSAKDREKPMWVDTKCKKVRELKKKWFSDRPGTHVEDLPRFMRSEVTAYQLSWGGKGQEIIQLRIDWHCLSEEEKTESRLSWIHKEVYLKWHHVIMSPWDIFTDHELRGLSLEELTHIKRVEEEEEWRRDSKWRKIFKRKEVLDGDYVDISRKYWFAAWSPSFRPRSTEFREWALELWKIDREIMVFMDEELWAQAQLEEARLEQAELERDLELVEQQKRLARIEPAKRFASSLVTLTGSDIPDEDCPICLESLSSDECVALPCSKPHCFHRDCVRFCFGKAMFQCSVCRADHSSVIDLFR